MRAVSLLLVSSLALCQAIGRGHSKRWLAQGNWSNSTTLTADIQDITLPLGIQGDTTDDLYRMYQDFGFTASDEKIYPVWPVTIGMTTSNDTSQGFHAYASIFGPAATATSSECTTKVDERFHNVSTVTCAKGFPGRLNQMYNFSLRRTTGINWSMEISDPSSNPPTRYSLGQFSVDLPGISVLGRSFVTYANPNADCGSIPYTTFTFGRPTTTEKSANLVIENLGHDTDCEDDYGDLPVTQNDDGSWSIDEGSDVDVQNLQKTH